MQREINKCEKLDKSGCSWYKSLCRKRHYFLSDNAVTVADIADIACRGCWNLSDITTFSAISASSFASVKALVHLLFQKTSAIPERPITRLRPWRHLDDILKIPKIAIVVRHWPTFRRQWKLIRRQMEKQWIWMEVLAKSNKSAGG